MAFIKFLTNIVISFVSSIYGGYVLSVLWGWFVVPLGVMTLSVPMAMGIILCFNVPLTGAYLGIANINTELEQTKKPEDRMNVLSSLIVFIVAYSMLLLTGFVVQSFL